ncbi:MAG: bifunctional nuclease family protein [Candidatus Handelsmanbacteria bacterium]|nr:bifunctional nuclease family protein [Candidatus Handelsmanbacteria bacterium]
MDDKSVVEMSVVKVSPYLKIERPLLWLCEKSGPRPLLLPIAIGQFEAAAIQMHLEQEEPSRPISYDLLTSILNRLSAPLRRVLIHTARKQIYYARITIETDRQLRELDSRPSDAIALALRTGAPIFVTRELLDLVGYETEEGEAQISEAITRFSDLEPHLVTTRKQAVASVKARLRQQAENPATAQIAEVIEPASPADLLSLLQARLEQAVLCEQYEEAAKLRDQIELLVNRSRP